MDSSADMVRTASRNFPDITFLEADARSLSFQEPFDAVFSNAALHWIKEADEVLDSITRMPEARGKNRGGNGGQGEHRRRSVGAA